MSDVKAAPRTRNREREAEADVAPQSPAADDAPRAERIRQPLTVPPVLNQTWLGFMTETLYDGRRVRLLTMIEEGNREGLDIVGGVSIPSRRVIRVLEALVVVHGCPSAIRVDNGPEFTAQPCVRLV